MKKVKVLIPFIVGETGELLKEDTEHDLSEEVISKALAINPNMLLVLGEAKKSRAKKAE